MAEIQKEFSSLNAEMKEIDSIEKRAICGERYKEYLFKIGTYGYGVEPEEKIEDATEDDRETAGCGASGLVYTQFSNNSDFGFLLLKSKEDYPRVKKVLILLDAVNHLKDEKEKDKDKYIKILLGEN
jgi:hypothetical protein